MANPAICVENLSKRYRIKRNGDGTSSYGTLRDTISEAIQAPLRRLRAARSVAADTGTFWALRDVHLEVHPGEVVGIIGRNGAGKSTLLKVLSRITEPTRGRVMIQGRLVSLLEVGTGFHQELTGRENLYLNGAVLGMTRREICRKEEEIIAFAEVEKFIDTPVKRYSSGMYLRLAFAVAAHLEPEVLLVDEVLAVGDAGFQSKCLKKLTDVAREGRTVLFVSHSMGAISQLCRSAVWVEKGRVAGRGPTADVIARYMTSTSASDGQWTASGEGPSGQPARMLRATVCTADGQPGNCMGFSRPFSFEFLYEIRETMCYTVTLRLRNQTGLTIFTSSERDTTDWDLLPRPPGIYRARVKIPGGLLAVGAYSLTFGVFDTVWEAIDRRENGLSFEIVPDINCTINEGVITPFLDWEVERHGN